jgi:myo-inositol-1(or 4)-monophosphatase
MKRTLIQALKRVGGLLARTLHAAKKIDYKSEANLVTQVDKRAEKIIIEMIRREHPGHAILAEESAPSGRSRYKWIIDPLDGTTNFAHTFPVACVSIALEKDGAVILGGVFDPFRNELFLAEKNRGATLNGRPISVSRTKRLHESLLCTGFPYDRRNFAETYLRIFAAFMVRCHGVRRTGSAALDICYVGCGRFDGFWELKLNPWDTAASSLVCAEAGGKLTDFEGNPYSIYIPEALASNGRIHREMLAVLKKCYRRARSRSQRAASSPSRSAHSALD